MVWCHSLWLASSAGRAAAQLLSPSRDSLGGLVHAMPRRGRRLTAQPGYGPADHSGGCPRGAPLIQSIMVDPASIQNDAAASLKSFNQQIRHADVIPAFNGTWIRSRLQFDRALGTRAAIRTNSTPRPPSDASPGPVPGRPDFRPSQYPASPTRCGVRDASGRRRQDLEILRRVSQEKPLLRRRRRRRATWEPFTCRHAAACPCIVVVQVP
mmetsp:Transcript_6954/g.23771  ORF Transcript_6954/g.23771 Transcript_6954/m.23771 type:complete len:211 (-) Transcript_6954:950-1582(-)